MGEYEVRLQNQSVDISGEFGRQANHFFVGERTEGFDAASASGKILWKGLSFKQRVSYHQLPLQLEDYKVWEDPPPGEYEDDQILPFSLPSLRRGPYASALPAPTLCVSGSP